jgi:hypothetical protein
VGRAIRTTPRGHIPPFARAWSYTMVRISAGSLKACLILSEAMAMGLAFGSSQFVARKTRIDCGGARKLTVAQIYFSGTRRRTSTISNSLKSPVSILLSLELQILAVLHINRSQAAQQDSVHAYSQSAILQIEFRSLIMKIPGSSAASKRGCIFP